MAATKSKKQPAKKQPAKKQPAKKQPGPASKAPAAGKAKPKDSAEAPALDASYEAPINVPVATISLEGRELVGILKKLGKKILDGSRLEASLIDGLPAHIDALDAAEKGWVEMRTVQLPTAKKKLRTSAEELRSDAIAALRHFAASDARLQAQLDRVVEGSGLADLIDDLKQLAPLLDQHADKLKRAQLPADPGARLSKLAQELDRASSDEASERAGSDEARAALALRNRTYWQLREVMDEIRECGRHAFRKSPELLKHFRSSYSRNNQRSRPASPNPTP